VLSIEYSASRNQTRNKTTTESDVDKAEALNDQFTGVFTKKTDDQVPLLERKIPKMKDIRITEGGVLKLLQGLNISKARSVFLYNGQMLAVVQSSGSALLSVVCWKKCVIILLLTHLTVPSIFVDLSHLDHVLSTLGYMIKTLNQIFFFLHLNQNIFFSNIGNQNIFLEKKHTPSPPFQVKWSFLYIQNFRKSSI
jgi:hypothetical protein